MDAKLKLHPYLKYAININNEQNKYVLLGISKSLHEYSLY